MPAGLSVISVKKVRKGRCGKLIDKKSGSFGRIRIVYCACKHYSRGFRICGYGAPVGHTAAFFRLLLYFVVAHCSHSVNTAVFGGNGERLAADYKHGGVYTLRGGYGFLEKNLYIVFCRAVKFVRKGDGVVNFFVAQKVLR